MTHILEFIEQRVERENRSSRSNFLLARSLIDMNIINIIILTVFKNVRIILMRYANRGLRTHESSRFDTVPQS